MKQIVYFTLLLIVLSCASRRQIGITQYDVLKVEVIQSGNMLEMKEGFENQLIEDLNNAKYNGPTKFMKTHMILIYHSNASIDTVMTNGQTHQYRGWYLSEENLIEKYSKK